MRKRCSARTFLLLHAIASPPRRGLQRFHQSETVIANPQQTRSRIRAVWVRPKSNLTQIQNRNRAFYQQSHSHMQQTVTGILFVSNEQRRAADRGIGGEGCASLLHVHALRRCFPHETITCSPFSVRMHRKTEATQMSAAGKTDRANLLRPLCAIGTVGKSIPCSSTKCGINDVG